MRYVDEKRLRYGYLAVFGLSTALTIGAYWDAANNGQAWSAYFLAGLGGLLVVALMFYLGTELILRDAVQVAPHSQAAPQGQPLAEAATPHSAQRSRISLTGAAPRPAAMAAPSTAPAPITAAPAAEELTAGPARPRAEPTAPRPPRRAGSTKIEIHISSPTDILVAADEPLAFHEEPHDIPKPAEIPVVLSPATTETIALEIGDPFAMWKPSTRKGRGAGRAIESTRVLCGACGAYFRFQTDAGRPQQVPCPRCEKSLVISGHQRMEPHLNVRCRSCGDQLSMPRMHEVSALQCGTCGQFNEIRSPAAVAKAKTDEAW